MGALFGVWRVQSFCDHERHVTISLRFSAPTLNQFTDSRYSCSAELMESIVGSTTYEGDL